MQWWLPHHAELFEHGIIVDYASTDDTVELVHKYCPTWEVRQSRNPDFSAADCDSEIMDIERELGDTWKMVLTASEFLCADVRKLTETLELQGCGGAQIRPVAMVDTHERMELRGDQSPLVECHTGYIGGWITPYKSRLLHKYPDGAYNIGRHSTNHKNVAWHPDNALLRWYGFAPWTSSLRERKLQIQQRIPADDIALGYGAQHLTDEAGLARMWQSEVAISGDLRGQQYYF